VNRAGNEMIAGRVAAAIIEAWKTWRRPPAPAMSPGVAGSGGAIPRIAVDEPRAESRRSWSIRVSRAPPAALGQLVLSHAPVSDPLTAMKDPSKLSSAALIPFRLEGRPGVPDSGTASVDVPFPAGPAWGPSTWYLRAMIADPGAPSGFSVSNNLTLLTR
jgi:hypothetical protein